MDTTTGIIIVIALVLAIGIVAWLLTQRRKEELRERFGPEYDRAVAEHGGPRQAMSELEARQARVTQLNIRPLTPEQRERYSEAWRSVQARFVDEPAAAIGEADRLLKDVLQARGYPVGDFEQRAADLSVGHPNMVEHYRIAHNLTRANEHGGATTEDLRQAMVHYRALFEDLLETTEQEVTR